MKLTALAPAKINLCLFLGPLRDDGRHELVTVLESVSLADQLELVEHEGAADEVHCEGVQGTNLAEVTLEGLRARGWDGPPVRLTIAKRIPVAAGMGGGSADAAATLRLAVALSPGRPEEVAELAGELGSDVPSQLSAGVAIGTGAGDVVETLEALAPHAVLVLPQPHPLSTAEVYREADKLGLPRTSDELAKVHERLLAALAPSAHLPGELVQNDLEPAAISLCPAIEDALRAAHEAGADRALVCGSGPTVIGLFWGADGAERARGAALALTGRFPAATCASPVGPEFGLPRFA